MNHYTIDILKADLSYVIEAIRMRGYAIAEQVASQALRQDHAEVIEKQVQEDPEPWNISVTTNGEMVAEKKPAAKPAKKRGRPSKKAAPFGLKKDGTPKAKPGRKTA